MYSSENNYDTLNAFDYAILGQSAFLTSATLGVGFRGKSTHGLGLTGGYLGGLQSDIMMARKIGNQTMASKLYNKAAVASPGLNAFAPSLSHFGISRYLNLWSALAGHQGAAKGLTMYTAMERSVAGAMNIGPMRYSEAADLAAKGINSTSFKGAAGETIYKLRSYRGGASVPNELWGDVFDSSNPGSLYNEVRSNLSKARFGWTDKAVGYAAGMDVANAAGATRGRFGNAVSKALVRSVGVNKNPLMVGIGLALPSAMRVAAIGTIGYDLYTIGTMVGGFAGKMFINQLNAPINRFKAATAELHRGTFMSSSYISSNVGATGRQRAMANIYEKQLNLRQVLGNEAAMMGMM